MAEKGFIPPSNLAAEQAVLGAIILRPQYLDLVIDLISVEDFYRAAHGKIFKAFLDLNEKQIPVDMVTVNALLAERGELEIIGGPLFLTQLSEQVGIASNIEYYAGLIKDKAIIRKLLSCSQEISGACLGQAEDAMGLVDWAEAELFKVAQTKRFRQVQSLAKLIPEEVDRLETIYRNKGKIGLETGFADIDRIIMGFHGGDMIILAARPGMGKSALAGNISYNVAKNNGIPVVFFSIEMQKEKLIQRQMAAVGGVDFTKIQQARMTNDEWAKISEAAGELMDMPIFIDDNPKTTIMDIRAVSRRLKAQNDLGLIIVDYIQLINVHKQGRSREQEVASMSASLKSLAKELNVPVIVLAQLNREIEKRTDKRPVLSDLRESGALEQDSDMVIFLYREESLADIHIAKNRNGSVGKCKLLFWDKFVRFDNYIESNYDHWQD